MNPLPVFSLVLLALTATAFAQDFRQLCVSSCKDSCTIADQACQLVPGLTGVCVASKAACNGICDSSCKCLFDCVDRCQGNAAECDNKEGNLVNPILCTAVQAVCLQTCGPSCGYDIASNAFQQIMALVMPQPQT